LYGTNVVGILDPATRERQLGQMARDGQNDNVGYSNPLIVISEKLDLPGLPANRHTIANPGRGNCLYYSVAQGLTSIGLFRGDHRQLRVQSLDLALIKRRDYQADCRLFLDMTVTHFHQYYSRSDEFGVDLCIIALVDLLKINIKVHYQSRSPENVFSHSCVTFSPTGGSQLSIEIICYTHRYHYESVLQGPAIALPSPPISEAHPPSSPHSVESLDFPQNISSIVAAPSMPAASVDSAVEKLYFVKGSLKRAAKSNPSNRAKKARSDVTEVSRPIVSGAARFTNQVVSLSDAGVLKIDGIFIMNYDQATMDLIRSLKLDLSKLRVLQNNGKGYLCVGGERLNCILGAALKKEHFKYLVSRGFTGTIDDLTHVSHNDGDSLNNNTSNLLNVPAEWNYSFNKPKEAKVAKRKTRVTYYQQVIISESTPHNTLTTFTDPDEALFHYDILKIVYCLNDIKLCAKLAQQLIFEFGLMRPEKFVQKGFYKDISTLLSFYEYYESLRGSSNRKGLTHVKLDRFRLLDLDDPDVTQAIRDALNVPGNLPFNPSTHVIFEYIGKKVGHQRICNRDFYESVVKHYTGGVGQDSDGYLMFNSLGMLHNLALGRNRGDHAKDKLQGCHGIGGILDNRVTKKADGKFDQRTLTLGTASTNQSHIVRKKVGAHSRYPGVSKEGKKWRADWRFDNSNYYLGTFSTEIEAANAYAHVQEHREEIAARLTPVPKDASKSAKKSLRAANLVIVKSYIRSTLHSTVAVIRDHQ